MNNQKKPATPLGGNLSITVGLVLIIVGLVLLQVTGVLPSTGDEEVRKVVIENELGGPIESEPIEKIPLDSIRYADGAGLYTFIEYVDLECLGCARQHETINGLRERFSGTIRFAIKHFPINVHETALERAKAAECAGQQGKITPFVDAAYALTDRTAKPTGEMQKIAESLELDIAAFIACQAEQETQEQVMTDAKEAMGTGAQGVPHAVLVDETGDIIAVFEGSLNKIQFTTQLEQLTQ